MKKYILALLLLTTGPCGVLAQARPFHLVMHTRDSITNRIIDHHEDIDVSRMAIIIIDPWNYHWCMTWTEQVGGMATRMNRALACARKLGIQILWAPTDVASMYSAWPQRQKALAVPYVDVPKLRSYDCHFTVPDGGCLCGPGIECKLNYGWDAINPELLIGERDLIVCGTQELYSICKSKGITHLLYFGGATNICVSGKPEGLAYMYGGGLETIFARDMAFAWSAYDPAKSYTPSTGNEQAADDLERAGIPTLSFVDALRARKMWNSHWITEPVRITPAGTLNRPYFFDTAVTVTLETPYLKDAVIRYTLDGAAPTSSSPRYRHPLRIDRTSTLRTAAFKGTSKVSLDGAGFFDRLPPMPPPPDVLVSTVTPVEDLYAAVGPVYAACLWQPVADKSYEQKPLRIREQSFQTGLGMRAPGYIRMNVQAGWKRFVALAGVDDNLLDVQLGRNIARYPKMKFRIFIDGRIAAESPVMRISQAPWRFNVPIPAGSRQLTLVCDDLGEKSPYNLGNYVNAGFCMQ